MRENSNGNMIGIERDKRDREEREAYGVGVFLLIEVDGLEQVSGGDAIVAAES
jgi:hypothetical protein